MLVGPNGCGKSTLLLLLGHYFHAVQSGESFITSRSFHRCNDAAAKIADSWRGIATLISTVLEIDHDGQAVRYSNPEKVIGLSCSNMVPDEDLRVPMKEAFARKYASMGERTRRGSAPVLAALRAPSSTEVKVSSGLPNYLGEQALAACQRLLQGSGPRGQPTTLLDEPDRSLDLPGQRELWDLIRSAASEHQIIIAAHSPFAMDIPGANYIELVPGYLGEVRDAVAALRRVPKKTA